MPYRSENYAGPKPRDARTVSDVRREKRPRPPVAGETDKVPVPTDPGLDRLRAVTAARNRAVAARPAPNVSTETGLMLNPALALAGILAFGNPSIAAGFRDTRALASGAKDVLLNPYSSRRDKLEAAGDAAVVGGGLSFLPGRKPKPPAAKPEGAEKIVEALPEARRVRAKQQAGYKDVRGERAAAMEAAYERAGGGQAGHIAGKAELRGELPKLPFDRLMKEFGAADSEMRAVFQPQVDEMLNSITAHPSFAGKPLTAGRARDALLKALDGVTPQKSEIRLLEQAFGEEAAEHFKWRAAREKALKLANLPRSLQASYDLSLILRQLLVSGVRHPVLWQRVFRAQIQAARSQKAADAMLDEIRARPRYDQMIDDGVKLTDIRVRPGRLEEDFIGSEYAEKIPLVGHGVRWSTRAFTVGGAKMRADLYDLFMDQAERAGKTLTKKERRALASVINAGTGRGGMGLDVLERAAPLGTVLLFSPRLIASRLAFFNPYWYLTLKGPARKEAASSLLSVLALGSSVLWLAKQLGAEVEMDPRSADFGKIQVGDTRVDIWGGFQQYVVNGYRYAVAETKSPSGEVKDKTREEILWNFASGKAAPLPGLVRDFQRGRTFDYQPVDETTVGKLFVPLNIQNAWDAKDDPALAGLSLGLGGIGLGVQTYGSDEEAAPATAASRPRSSAGRYRSSRSRYSGGPGRNYAGPRS